METLESSCLICWPEYPCEDVNAKVDAGEGGDSFLSVKFCGRVGMWSICIQVTELVELENGCDVTSCEALSLQNYQGNVSTKLLSRQRLFQSTLKASSLDSLQTIKATSLRNCKYSLVRPL